MTEVAGTPSTDAGTPSADPAAPVADGIKTFDLAYVQTLRTENAGLRVGNKDAVTAAQAALTAEFDTKQAAAEAAHAETKTALSERELDLIKLKAVIAGGVETPKILDFVGLVQGTDEATITEHVKTVKALLGNTAPPLADAVDPTQGGTGTPPIPLNGDPVLAALMKAVNRGS